MYENIFNILVWIYVLGLIVYVSVLNIHVCICFRFDCVRACIEHNVCICLGVICMSVYFTYMYMYMF